MRCPGSASTTHGQPGDRGTAIDDPGTTAVDDPGTAGRPDFLVAGHLTRRAADEASRRAGGRRVARHTAAITATLPERVAAASVVHCNTTPVNN